MSRVDEAVQVTQHGFELISRHAGVLFASLLITAGEHVISSRKFLQMQPVPLATGLPSERKKVLAQPVPAYRTTTGAGVRVPALSAGGVIGVIVLRWAWIGATAAVRFAGGPGDASPGMSWRNGFGEIPRAARSGNVPGEAAAATRVRAHWPRSLLEHRHLEKTK
jgi:hypothetical protein